MMHTAGFRRTARVGGAMSDGSPVWDFTSGASAAGSPPGGTGGRSILPGDGAEPWSPAGNDWLASAAPATVGGGVVGPPYRLLIAAATTLIVSLALLVLADQHPKAAIAGWVFAGFVSVGLLAAYLQADARRRTNPWYSAPPSVSVLRLLLFVASVLSVIGNSVIFALWFGRR